MTQITLFKNKQNKLKTSWFTQAINSLMINEDPGWPDLFGDRLSQLYSSTSIKPVRTLSLFSGGGGLDIGFHDAGFNIVECNEIEPAFSASLIENSKKNNRLSGSNIVTQDIREYTPELKDIDFIIGGPPCQTFSAAGARAAGVNGTDDERGNLFWEYVRILKQLQPKGFLFENVYRIVGAQGGEPWRQIQEAFRDVGYNLHWRILDAADYGAPQHRERLIIVGLKKGSYNFPFPTHGPESADSREYYTSGTAIENITIDDRKHKGLGGRHGYLLAGIPPGLNYSFYTERMGHPDPIFGWRSKFSDYLYKADSNRPVRTIKAQGGQYTGPFHWDSRNFTTEELKRLQTFPDDYKVLGGRQTAIHQLGNSVPPQFARILAISIMTQVFGAELPFPVQLMPVEYELGFRKRKAQLTKHYAKLAKEAIAKLPKRVVRAPFRSTGSAIVSVSKELKLIEYQSIKEGDFSINWNLDEDKWSLICTDMSIKNDMTYSVNISREVESNTENRLPNSIQFVARSTEMKSILALWKMLEKLLKDYLKKDDLVQLFGYYQYSQGYAVELNIHSEILREQDDWKVLQLISTGKVNRRILPIPDLVDLFGIKESKLLDSLRVIKELGYEIRSRNTNLQIPENHILIPYSFPSLNERSLQRATKL